MTKKEAIEFLEGLEGNLEVSVKIEPTDYYISSGEVEQLGVSRQLLRYHVRLGDVRTIPSGRQKKYNYADVIKLL